MRRLTFWTWCSIWAKNSWWVETYSIRIVFSQSHRRKIQYIRIRTIGSCLVNWLFQTLLMVKISVITDHRALLSILQEHRSSKSDNSRLSRWIDRLLPYIYSIEHMPGAKNGTCGLHLPKILWKSQQNFIIRWTFCGGTKIQRLWF